MISQQRFHFDLPNFQDSFSVAVSQTVLHIGLMALFMSDKFPDM